MSLKRKTGHRILALALTLTLVLSLPLFTTFESFGAAKFRDISGHWAEGFITRAYNQNVVNGYPDGRFYPDRSVTRAEFVSMVNNAFGINIDYGPAIFTDVTYDKWFYRAVATAVTAAYAGGFSDNTFRPNTPITRQEAAVMLSNILPNYKEKGNLKSFRDYRLIASWAAPAWEKMIGRQYFGAYTDGRLHPTDSLTRAQAAKILCDILNNETIITRRTIIDEDKTELSERVYADDMIIDEDLGEGSVTIDNCVILGTLTVEGGGSDSVTINNSRVANIVVDKGDTAVRIVAKGTTVIPRLSASGKSILQTTGKDGSGILDLTVNKNADVTLKGNFPTITVGGSSAVLALESGKIAALTVTGAGRYSDITLSGKAQLADATVNAECYFHGTGVITHMSVNADDVTYETRPKKMTVATTVDRAMEEGNTDVDVTFKPKHRATDVDVDTEITLTFTSSMKLADGKAITSSNIKDFVSLKLNSRNGEDVDFTASINSAKKVITIIPEFALSTSTRYYVVLEDEALVNAGGTKNDGASAYFTTGSRGGSTSASFSPANGATGVSANTSITIRFREDVVKSGDGGSVTAAYLQECVQLRSGGSGGAAVPFTASISSSDTITVTPTASLSAGQTYYVAIAADKLKTKTGGRAIPAAAATWTVAAAAPSPAAVLTSLTVSPAGGGNLLTGFSGATASYNVAMPFGTTGIDVRAGAAAGTTVQIRGVTTTVALNIPVQGNIVNTISVAASGSGMTPTTYTVNVRVTGNTSLSAITIAGISYSPDLAEFPANVAVSATSAAVSVTAADPAAVISLGGSTGTGSLTVNVSLGSGDQTVTFTVTSNMDTRTCTIRFTRI